MTMTSTDKTVKEANVTPEPGAESLSDAGRALEWARVTASVDHHSRCDSRSGEECDCYLATREEYAVLDALAAREAELATLREALENPKSLARLFHDTYERLAPEFGYVTRPESSVPWAEVPEPNRKLMIAVAAEVAAALAASSPEAAKDERSEA